MKTRTLLCLILSLALSLALALPAAARDDSHFVMDSELPGYLNAYTGPGGEVVFPEKVQYIWRDVFKGNTSVTRIVFPGHIFLWDRAFQDCTNLTEIVWGGPNSTISADAFNGCTSLTQVEVPNLMIEIKSGTFANCTALETVTTGEFIKDIRANAFANCTSLKRIVLGQQVASIDDTAFDNCPNLTIYGVAGSYAETYAKDHNIPFAVEPSLGLLWPTDPDFPNNRGALLEYTGGQEHVVIPEGITSISSSVFSGQEQLKSVVIPEGVTSIGYEAFYRCTNLKEVTFPSTLKRINTRAFAGVPIDTWELPEGLEEIDGGAFMYAPPVDIYVPASVKLIDGAIFGRQNGANQGFIMRGEAGSYAESYARQCGIEFHAGRRDSAQDANTAFFQGSSSVRVDDQQSYFNVVFALKDEAGNLTNYIPLRNLATLLQGTPAQFDVAWDGAVKLVPGVPYPPQPLTLPFDRNQPYTRSAAPTYIGDKAVELDTIVLTDDKGGGYTFYQLRDLGKALNFNVGWSADRGIYIETDKPYDPSN